MDLFPDEPLAPGLVLVVGGVRLRFFGRTGALTGDRAFLLVARRSGMLEGVEGA